MTSQPPLEYKRILLKVSGEMLCKTGGFGLDIKELDRICQQIKEIHDLGVQICMVIGGGNFTRGSSLSEMGINRNVADYIGMLGTIMNGLAMKDCLERAGMPTRVQSAIAIPSVAEPYIRGRALRHLDKGRVVIFAGGTGNTHFTTDTAAAQRAIEMDVEILMKGTKVDGVYSADPVHNTAAERFELLTYMDVLNRNLRVMDSTAISLCMEHNMQILVFNLKEDGNLKRAVLSAGIGTIVRKST
ncbi:UMP kinase [Planctomycetota bacterium]